MGEIITGAPDRDHVPLTQRQSATQNEMSGKTLISVAVCTHRNPNLLSKTLESLTKQTIARDLYEVIVVDNNSQDKTKDVVARYPSSRYVFEGNLGLSHARNCGIREAQGDIVAFIDDDAEASPYWLDALLRVYDEFPDAWAVGGKVLPLWDAEKPKWLTEAHHYPRLSLRDYGHITRRMHWPHEGMIGTNCSFKRQVFTKVGLFDTNLGRIGNILCCFEESEVQARIIKNAWNIYYASEAIVYHHVPQSRMTKTYFNKRYLGSKLSEAMRNLLSEGRRDEVEQIIHDFHNKKIFTIDNELSLNQHVAQAITEANNILSRDAHRILKEKADRAISQQDFNTAITALVDRIGKFPASFDTHADLINLHFAIGNYGGAFDAIEKAIMIFGKNRELTLYLGNYFFSTGNFSDAENEFKTILNTEPTNTHALVHLGFICLSTQRYQEALEYGKKTCLIDQTNVDGWICQGLAANYLNDKFLSRTVLQKAYNLNPSHPLLEQFKQYP